MSTEQSEQLPESEAKRNRIQQNIIKILDGAGIILFDRGNIDGIGINLDTDVHAFIKAKLNPNKVIHIQAYPGFSDNETFCLTVREMDGNILTKIRQLQENHLGPSIGNEHEAVKRWITGQIRIPYSFDSLIALLKPELPISPITAK
jgi:hypothetical protein